MSPIQKRFIMAETVMAMNIARTMTILHQMLSYFSISNSFG